MKSIFKNPMTMLYTFKFSNTNMTTDGLKLVKKIPTNHLTMLFIAGYAVFNPSETLRQARYMRPLLKHYYKNQIIHLNIDSFDN